MGKRQRRPVGAAAVGCGGMCAPGPVRPGRRSWWHGARSPEGREMARAAPRTVLCAMACFQAPARNLGPGSHSLPEQSGRSPEGGRDRSHRGDSCLPGRVAPVSKGRLRNVPRGMGSTFVTCLSSLRSEASPASNISKELRDQDLARAPRFTEGKLRPRALTFRGQEL